MNGQELFEKLGQMTEKERKHCYVDRVYTWEDVEFELEAYKDCECESNKERKAIEALLDDEKWQEDVVKEAAAYVEENADSPVMAAIRTAIVNHMEAITDK